MAWRFSYLSIAETKRALQCNPNADEALELKLQELIDAACRAVERYIGRGVVRRDYVDVYDGNGGDFMYLRNPPAVVESVHWDPLGEFGETTLLVKGPAIDADYVVPAVPEGASAGGNCVELIGGRFGTAKQALRVAYAGGWPYDQTAEPKVDEVPDDVKQATLLAVRNLWNLGVGKQLQGVSSVSGGRGSVMLQGQIEMSSALPKQARDLLEPYVWGRA